MFFVDYSCSQMSNYSVLKNSSSFLLFALHSSDRMIRHLYPVGALQIVGISHLC